MGKPHIYSSDMSGLNDARGKISSLTADNTPLAVANALTFNYHGAHLVQVEWQGTVAEDADLRWDPKVRIQWHRGQAIFSVEADAEWGSVCIPVEGDVQVTAWDQGGGNPGSAPMTLSVGWYEVSNPIEWQATYTSELGTVAAGLSSAIVPVPAWTSTAIVDSTNPGGAGPAAKGSLLVGYKNAATVMMRADTSQPTTRVTSGGQFRRAQVFNSGAADTFSIVFCLRRKSM